MLGVRRSALVDSPSSSKSGTMSNVRSLGDEMIPLERVKPVVGAVQEAEVALELLADELELE